MKQKKYALVLSGGGFKGAYQLGALRYLRDNWRALTGAAELRFDLIAGVSAGALNGVLVASERFDLLEALWALVCQDGAAAIYHSDYIEADGRIRLRFDQLKKDLLPHFKVNAALLGQGAWHSVRKVFHKNGPGLIDTLLAAAEKDFNTHFRTFRSLADNKALEALLRQNVSLAGISASTTFLCGLVSLYDGLYYSLSNQSFERDVDFVQAILASSSMPIIWPPVPIIHVQESGQPIQNAVDGGLRNNSPLKDVVDFINADPDSLPYEVIIINCNSGTVPPMEQAGHIGDIALRALTEVTLAEIFNNDVRSFLKMNELVRQAAGKVALQWKGQALRYFDYQLIQPKGHELGDTLDSRAETLIARETLGYRQAEAAFRQSQ